MAPYEPTKPVLGGLRVEPTRAETRLSVQVSTHRLVKLLPIYQRYCAEPPLEPKPGFVVGSLHSFAESDIVVLQELGDIDSVRNEHLAHASKGCNFQTKDVNNSKT